MDSSASSAVIGSLARFIGIFAPSLYCGFTASDSLTFVQPIVNHAPNQKIMAKQWYNGYQYGPSWVPALIGPGTLANLYLAYQSLSTVQRSLYIAAAIGIFSILPITFLYMEPGINGANKWKMQTLLKDEGFEMPDNTGYMPSARKHGSTPASRRWAEESDMKDLIRFWQKVNNLRWMLVGAAAMLNGVATFGL